MLAIHRGSLKTLRLGFLGYGGQGFINLSNFPSVEVLHLSAYCVTCSPEVACSNFLAARLRSFTLDYGVYDQHPESWTAFGPTNAQWLHKFADLAILRKSSLRRITVLFNPGISYLSADLQALRYPWDLMDEIRDAIKPNGIDLSYSEPCVSKQEFQRLLEKAEAERVGRSRGGNMRAWIQ